MNRTPIRNEQGKVCGEVIGDTFYKTLRSDQFYREIPGITYSVGVLEKLAELGVSYLHVTNSETGTVYQTTLRNFWRHPKQVRPHPGIPRHYCLPYEFWGVTRGERPIQERMF